MVWIILGCAACLRNPMMSVLLSNLYTLDANNTSPVVTLRMCLVIVICPPG